MKIKPIMAVMMMIMLVSLIFAVQGIGMHLKVSSEEAKFHELQDKYFTLSKEARDTAETDSSLNKQLAEIQNYPSELLRLKLVGVGRILTGIYILLFGILIALVMMPARLASIIGKK